MHANPSKRKARLLWVLSSLWLLLGGSPTSPGVEASSAAKPKVKRADLYVSLWPKKHRVDIRAELQLYGKMPTKLKLYLSQLIQLKKIAQRRQGKWRPVGFKRGLETVLVTLLPGTKASVRLKATYSIVFHSRKNYLFRAIFCRIDPQETYVLYGWYPSLQPFADPLQGTLLGAQRYDYRLHLEVPGNQVALSSGPRVKSQKLASGRRLFVYRPSALKEAAIFFSAGPFVKKVLRPRAGVEVEFYLRRSDRQDNLPRLSQMIVKAEALYTRLWGAPAPKGKRKWRLITFGGSGARGYPFTLLLDRSYGFFHASLAENVDSLFTRRQILLHEMAHTWWGNAVTGIGKASMWINEGLANYASLRAEGALYGLQAERAGIRRHIQSYLRSKGKGGLLDPGGMAQMAQRTAYTKGAVVFFELERQIGRKAVDRGLRLFFAAHRGKFARLKDLKKALERGAKRKLDGFFRDWIAGRKLPLLRLAGWSGKGRRQVTLRLGNTGGIAGTAIVVATSARGKRKELLLRVPAGATRSFRRTLPFAVKSLQFDPHQIAVHGFRVRALFDRANAARRAGQLAQASALFRRLLKSFPKHGQALYSFGLLRAKQGKKRPALALFRRASQIAPGPLTPGWVPLWSRFRMAVLLRALGQKAKAKAIFKALLKQAKDPYGLKQRIRSLNP